MPETILTEPRYAKLVADIRKLIEEGQSKAAAAANRLLLQSYWQIGRRIDEEGLLENAGYGEAVLEDLAEELDIDSTTLRRCILFSQEYKSATSSSNLTWSHYKYLLSLTDDAQRQWYEEQAEKEHWSVLRLSQAIREGRYEALPKSKAEKKTSAKLTRPSGPAYLYKALVERVIDGDTLLLNIDLGFQIWKEQRIRLAGIDAPAIDEPEGEKACRYVLNQLARAKFVMVKTNKIDVYGRYIGHVFYSLKEASMDEVFQNGSYLNQELVDEGLAGIV